MWDLKAAKTIVKRSLIRELMVYEFELGHNAAETTKDICCTKGEGTLDQSAINRWLKKYHKKYYINNDVQASWGGPRIVDSGAVL